MTDLDLPPGFRFHPTDDELVQHYLCRKCASQSIAVPIIAEIDLYKYDPWNLPGMALYGEKEWYFFSPRDRKYPNGSRPNRAAGSGYWKATGADKPIRPNGGPKAVGIKKALVFYSGKAPKGEKTNWIMHEYRLADVDRSSRKKNSLRLDDWVLCRIYNKKGALETKPQRSNNFSGNEMEEAVEYEEQKPEILTQARESKPQHQPMTPSVLNDFAYFNSSESIPRLQPTDSSCSEHVICPDFTCDREVQSAPNWRQRTPLQIPMNNMDAISSSSSSNPFLLQMDGVQLSPLFRDPYQYQDILNYLQKPF